MSRRRDHIAQWVFDTRSILGRFHLWLEGVDESFEGGGAEHESFVGPGLERALIMGAAVTALATRLFGGHGEGRDLDKKGLNRVKKDADAVSAYALSEALWYLTRALPENHAVMVSLGEGLMPKGGETPEMGSNPLLGFGRIYGRPQVAMAVEHKVRRLLNDDDYGWEEFWSEVQTSGITIWGAAIDTLENTSRFAKGSDSGPMTILHLFDQPLHVTAPYEGYIGCLIVPRAVREAAASAATLLSFHTPRRLVMDAILEAFPEVTPERVHVWTLGGETRAGRIGDLWHEWRQLGADIIEPGFELPDGGEVFTESGTYAPIYRVGAFTSGGEQHLLVFDGYAASAEAIQAASLDPCNDNTSALSMLSARFELPITRERDVWRLDPDADSFASDLADLAGEDISPALAEGYRDSLRDARDAGMPTRTRDVTIDDFFPRKTWRVLALAGYMLPDPYTGSPGVEELGENRYRVTVRASTGRRSRTVTLDLRLTESQAQSRLVFSPLLERFCTGEDHRERPVKISDSGRIRNELQTLCSEALEHFGDRGIRVHFDRIDDAVLPAERKKIIRSVLQWYKESHPIWFGWLELCD